MSGSKNEKAYKSKRLSLLLQMFAMGDEIKKRACLVFIYLLNALRKGEAISISQVSVANAIQLCPSQVSKAVKSLVERGILEPDTNNDGRKTRFKLVQYDVETLESKIMELHGIYDEPEDDDE